MSCYIIYNKTIYIENIFINIIFKYPKSNKTTQKHLLSPNQYT